MKRTCLHILSLISLLLFFSDSLAQVGISPRLLELDQEQINKGQSFRLFNFTGKDVEVEVEISHWTMSQDNTIKLLPSEPHSLDQWSIINPLNFHLKSKFSQTIRLAFRPPADIQQGEYMAMVYFNQVITDDQPEKKQVRAKFRMGAGTSEFIGLSRVTTTPIAVHNSKTTAADDVVTESIDLLTGETVFEYIDYAGTGVVTEYHRTTGTLGGSTVTRIGGVVHAYFSSTDDLVNNNSDQNSEIYQARIQ